MPNIDPSAIEMLSNYMRKNLCDIATLGSKFKDNKEIYRSVGETSKDLIYKAIQSSI